MTTIRPTIRLYDKQAAMLEAKARRCNRTVANYIECLVKLAATDHGLISLSDIGDRINTSPKETT